MQSLRAEQTGPVVRSLAQNGQLPFAANQPIPFGFDFPKAAIAVEFRPNTSLLTANGIAVLRDLAVALSNEDLSTSVFQVGAHLNANPALSVSAQRLSAQRAQVVVEHLVAFYNINQNRLIPMGYGQTTPVAGLNPADPQNERIEVINVDELVR